MTAVAVALTSSAALARPCADNKPFVVNRVALVVYTNDEFEPPYRTPCRIARRVVRRFLTTGHSPKGWRCKNSITLKRCVKGRTFIDDYGNRQWEHLAGWHGLD
jgi:hypothetical protein